jgi:ABC-2 type transport system ATP-binding protein
MKHIVNAVEAINLTRAYNTHIVVDNLSFSVKSGTVFGLLGPNGAGKSTTIKMLTTLLPPTLGTATIEGYDIINNPSGVRHSIGYVPQLISADGELTGYENLKLSAQLYGLSSNTRALRIENVLLFMGLKEFSNQLVKEYSGGMIRRLEIAQALLHEPKVLFLDEPTVGLDPSARKSLWVCIETYKKQFGTTILFTTHDMDEADHLCDIVAFMHLGKIVLMDTPSHLKKAIGPHASLDDVFMQYTGTSIKEGGDYNHAKQVRNTISHLD